MLSSKEIEGKEETGDRRQEREREERKSREKGERGEMLASRTKVAAIDNK